MANNTHGGGANTNAYGLKFEQDTSLNAALLKAGYVVAVFAASVCLRT